MDSKSSRPLTNVGLISLAFLVLIALVVWFPRSDGASAQPSVPVSAPIPQAATAPVPIAAFNAPDSPDTGERSAVRNNALIAEAPVAPVQATPEEPDLEARDWLMLRVVDERQEPIFDAEVMIRGLRKKGDEGSWYGMRGGETKARTGRDGRARVDYTRWADIDGKAIRVDLLVSHTDFIPFREDSFVLAPGEQTIELKQGAMVWLTAWHGSPDRVVPDVQIALELPARLGQEGWTRERDGRWSTLRLAPGPHWVTVTHESAELGRLASEFTHFELGEHARLDLALELKPLVLLRGRLDDSVPRPIVNGHVQVNLHKGDEYLSLYSDHEALVAADGSFEIAGLRAASGQVIALCDGWVSKLVPPRTLEESRTRMTANAAEADKARVLARAQQRERLAQWVDVAAGQELVIEMEPTGELEVRVTDEQGAPLAGVSISAWPNVLWTGVGSIVFPWRDWSAISDANGIGRIANLPPNSKFIGAEATFVGVEASTHQLRKVDRDTHPKAVVESGKNTRLELVLEKIP